MQIVTAKEKEEFVRYWSRHREWLESQRISEETMRWFCIYTAPRNVGYGMSELRPGKMGQWDLYYYLTDCEINVDKTEAVLASGLSSIEIADQERRNELESRGVDPDSPQEVTRHEMYSRMSHSELDEEIARLKALLGLTPVHP